MAKIQKQAIKQIWITLVKNAVEAMSERDVNDGKIYIYFKNDELNHIVEVRDNAKGIDEKKIKTLFAEPLNSTKTYAGMGIGLFVANKVLEKHDGTIEVKNHNDGACFTLRIPKPKS